MALQALMVVVYISVIGILASPVLPLIREWPAQWIGLLFELDLVDDALHGTSTGSNHIGGEIMLHMTSLSGMRLIVSCERGAGDWQRTWLMY